MTTETVSASAPAHQLVGQLRKLLYEENRVHNGVIPPWHAHPGPGIISTMSDHMNPHAVDIVCDEGLDGKTCELIVASVNALPALLAIAEAALAVQDGLDMRDEDEAEWAAAGQRVSAIEMHDRRMRLARALSSLPNARDDRAAASAAPRQSPC